MQNSEKIINHGAFFLHPGNQLYVQEQGGWTDNRRASLTAVILGLALTSGFLVAALLSSHSLITSFSVGSGLNFLGGLLVCLFLAAWSLKQWGEYQRDTRLELHGTLIYGEILELNYESVSDGSPVAVVKYAFTSPSGSIIENTEQGRGKFPTGDTTGIYILYLEDNVYAAL